MNKWPKISVVTPSYNQSAFLEKTIQSVVGQNYPNFEYIIIDGGSTDGSVDIIRKYSDKLAYWVSETDNGQTNAINKGFKHATGEIVAWLNSDDEYCPGALEIVGRVFMSNPELDFVYGNRESIDWNGMVLRNERHTRFSYAALILHGMVLTQPSSFWKRDLFYRFGYLDESLRFCMDYEFFCRIGQYIKAKHVRYTLSRFRWHEKSKSATIQDIQAAEHNTIAKRYIKAVCGGFPVWLVKLQLLVGRSFWYTIQGDFLYVVRGVIRRILPPWLRPRSL